MRPDAGQSEGEINRPILPADGLGAPVDSKHSVASMVTAPPMRREIERFDTLFLHGVPLNVLA